MTPEEPRPLGRTVSSEGLMFLSLRLCQQEDVGKKVVGSCVCVCPLPRDQDGICLCLCNIVTGAGCGGNRLGAVGLEACTCVCLHAPDGEGSCR